VKDYLPFNTLLSDPLDTYKRAALLAALGLLLGLIVPGLLRYQFKTLFPEQVATHLSESLKEKWDEFNGESRALQSALTTLDKRIVDDASTSDQRNLVGLFEFRRALVTYINERKPPFHVAGFYLDPIMFVWSAFYISFFWLLFMLAPNVEYERRWRSYSLMFAGLTVLLRWPTWLRNAPPLRDMMRSVYADANFDVSWQTFFLQECNALILVWGILELFLVWSSYLTQWRKEISSIRGLGPLNITHAYWLTQTFSRQFIHWQLCSLLLAFAFIPYTFFFWRYVVDFGDPRYLPHALIMHAAWGACWVAVSLPLAQTWYDLLLKQAMTPYEAKGVGQSGEAALTEKAPGSPVGSLNVIASIVAALATFGFPIFNALLLRR
jgi:hypothetical protein